MNPSKRRDAFDVVVIGSGPGGYVAALKAQAAGLRTAIVEKDPRFGGTCLHVGCIPSKVFLHTASLLDEIRAAKKIGIEVASPSLDWDGLKRRSRRVIAKLAGGVSLLLKRGGVEAVHGFGRLAGPGPRRSRRPGRVRGGDVSRPGTSSSPPVPRPARCPSGRSTATGS